METDHERLFRQIEPPVGGVERFKQKLAQADNRRGRGVWIPAAATVSAAVLAVVGFWAWHRNPAPEPPPQAALWSAPELDRVLGRPSAPIELRVQRNNQVTLLVEHPSDDPRVRIYSIN